MTENVTSNSVKKGVCWHCGSGNLREFVENEEKICMDCSAVNADAPATDVMDVNTSDDGSTNKNKTIGVFEGFQHNRIVMHSNLEWERSSTLIRNIKARDSTEKNLAFAFSCMVTVSSDLNISKEVLMKALSLYKKVVEKRLTRRGSIQSFCAGTLYMASILCNTPKSLPEIANASRTSRRSAFIAYKVLLRELRINVPPPRLREYFDQAVPILKLDSDIVEMVAEMLDSVEKIKLHLGKDPKGMVAAAVYIAAVKCGKKITQRELSKQFNITELTIRKRVNELSFIENKVVISEIA